MQEIELAVQPRSVSGKRVATLRRAGFVPAVLYGPGMPSLSIQVEARQMEQVLGRAGRTGLIGLTVNNQRYDAVIREVQRHPTRGTVEHVDFLRVARDRLLRADVPILLTGDSPAVRAGGALIHGLTTLAVEARPGDVPHAIQVDLSRLEHQDDSVHVRDLAVGKQVRVLAEPGELVVKVMRSRAEVEAAAEGAAPATPTPSAVERPA